MPIYGGKPIRGQIDKLQRGADVVIGTPGRVIDLIGRGALDLRAIQIVVLDEADRMLDIGFRPDIEKILRRCPKERQTLLLSATVPPPVERLARTYMRDPEVMNFSPKNMSVETIEQFYFTVDHEQKFELLVELLKRDKPEQAIVFCRTKRGTEKILSPACEELSRRRHDARRHGARRPRPRDEGLPRGRGADSGGHRRRRPRHRRDRASRTSSTTTSRSRPTTTSTASAAPAAWAAKASPTRSSPPKKAAS